MKKHTLLIHHLEETWRDGLANFGMTPEDAALNIIDYLHSPKGARINNVILTTWEMPGPCDVQLPITDYLTSRGIPFEHHIFGYAEVRDMYEGQNCTLIQATRYEGDPNQIVCIEDWHRDLASHTSVSLCGAFDGECIQDAEDMLTHVRGENGYEKIGSLTTGTHETYWRALDYEASFLSARELIKVYEERIENAGDQLQSEKILDKFTKAMKRLSRQPAFQILVRYMGEQVGHLYSDNEELDEAINSVVTEIDLRAKVKLMEEELCPDF